MINILPAPNEPQTWSKRAKEFLGRHQAIYSLVIWTGIAVGLCTAFIVYLVATEAINTASRAFGVG